MKRWMLAAMVAGALLAGGTRPARACGSGGSVPGIDVLTGVGALAVVVGDVAFSVADAALAAQDRQPPVAYGVFETLVAAPQAALLGYWTYDTLRADRDAFLPVVLTLWTAGLTVHGIYTIARADSALTVDEPPRHASVDWRVAPAMVSAGPSSTAPGAVLFGRF